MRNLKGTPVFNRVRPLLWRRAELSVTENCTTALKRLAAYLRGEGVTVGTRVALGTDRSLEMIVGMLAVLKAERFTCRWTRVIRPSALPCF